MIDKKLNLNHTISENLPVVRETFVQYYGEEYREIIENRFSNCTYIGYFFPDDIKKLLTDLFKEKSLELIGQFLKKSEIEVNDENIKRYFGSFYTDLRYSNISNLGSVFKILANEVRDEQDNSRLFRLLMEISGDNDLIEGSDSYYQIIDHLEQMNSNFEEMLLEFENFKSKYHEYTSYVDSCEELKKRVKNKYQLIYLKEIYEYLDEHDKSLVDGADQDNIVYRLNCYGILCDFNYANKTLLDSFSKESNEKMDHPDVVSSWILNNIYRDRIRFFKKNGIDLGDDYANYQNDKRCLDIIPSSDFVDKIIKIREDVSKRENMEYISSISLFQEQLKEIEDLDLLDKNTSYRYDGLLNGIICVNPNVKKTDDGMKLHCLLLFALRLSKDIFDKSFIHECNHLVETELLDVDGDIYRVRSGFEVLEDKANTSHDSTHEKKREFESFSEIINELIAQDITELLHRDGNFLFDNPETSRIRGGTSYESYRFLVQEFFDYFKQDIIYSRMTGDMGRLYGKVGKENFLDLNAVVHNFANYFSGFKIYNVYDKINQGIQDEDVKFYYDCIARKDAIFAGMKEYESNHSYSK